MMSTDRDPNGTLRHAPGPSPWYLRHAPPIIDGFSWEQAGEDSLSSGKMLLVGTQGPVGIFNFCNYVMALDERKLLVWHQRPTFLESPTEPVRLLIIEPAVLAPFDTNLKWQYKRMNSGKAMIALGGAASRVLNLPTTNVQDELTADFPADLKPIEELLILCNSSGIDLPEGSGMLALMVVHPRQAHYQLYPQDWFNTGGIDYGYQWVTRVARNPRTHEVHGEGFRIDPFVLDHSLRWIQGAGCQRPRS
jgi:hypothetical protein